MLCMTVLLSASTADAFWEWLYHADCGCWTCFRHTPECLANKRQAWVAEMEERTQMLTDSSDDKSDESSEETPDAIATTADVGAVPIKKIAKVIARNEQNPTHAAPAKAATKNKAGRLDLSMWQKPKKESAFNKWKA